MNETIDPNDPYPRSRLAVLDAEMSYLDQGTGDPIIFLHGNPTLSYLWRNVIPHVNSLGRCLAPDLIGMGRSGPAPSRSYRFVDHSRYLDAWFEGLKFDRKVTLVLHDWGSALGFHWARRNPERVRAIAYMEAIVQPRRWEDFPKDRVQFFKDMRSERGEQMVLDQNFFIETLLPRLVLRRLGDAEMEAYRRPFPDRDSRLPMLFWPRGLPIEGEPSDVVAIVEEYGRWLASSGIPKLFISAEPGSMLIGPGRDFCRGWPNQKEVTVRGLHFIQEDSPNEIGTALAAFIRGVFEDRT